MLTQSLRGQLSKWPQDTDVWRVTGLDLLSSSGTPTQAEKGPSSPWKETLRGVWFSNITHQTLLPKKRNREWSYRCWNGIRQHLAQIAMALGANSGNQSVPREFSLLLKEPIFSLYHRGLERGPVDQNPALGKDPTNRITAPANLREESAFCGLWCSVI